MHVSCVSCRQHFLVQNLVDVGRFSTGTCDIHNMFIVFVAFVLSGIAAAVYASGN